jgi:dipeptidyl-peptidase-4
VLVSSSPQVTKGPVRIRILHGPLLLIHGLLDDNVLPVHTMKLSAALLSTGRPPTVLPLPGACHMGAVTDQLWEFEPAFLPTSLGLD